jgi:hypothetical protein
MPFQLSISGSTQSPHTLPSEVFEYSVAAWPTQAHIDDKVVLSPIHVKMLEYLKICSLFDTKYILGLGTRIPSVHCRYINAVINNPPSNTFA